MVAYGKFCKNCVSKKYKVAAKIKIRQIYRIWPEVFNFHIPELQRRILNRFDTVSCDPIPRVTYDLDNKNTKDSTISFKSLGVLSEACFAIAVS
jgi:hypothetical protein